MAATITTSLTPEKAKLLKGTIAAKDKKIQTLEACIEDLRKQLLEQAQATAMRQPSDAGWAEKLSTAMSAIDGLRADLTQAKAARQKAVEAKDALQSKLEQVTQDSGKQATASQRQRAELERAAKEITEHRSKIAKLQAELNEARSKLEATVPK
jgi:chromosome segregation ATPase